METKILERIEKLRSLVMRMMPPETAKSEQLDKILEGFNPTLSEIKALMMFKAGEAFKMKTLAENTGMPLPTATHVVDRLVKAGVVKRGFNEKDRRVIIVEITSKGKKIMSEFEKMHKERIKALLSILDETDRRNMLSAMDKFIGAMENIREKVMQKKAGGK